MDISFQKEMQTAFGKFYNNCNYPTTVAKELFEVLQDKYDNNLASFREQFVKPTQNLLKTLQDKRMPLYRKEDETVKIIVHLAISKTVGTGEFLFCIGRTKPGTLTLRFCKYVTQLEDKTTLANPMYDTVKMTVREASYDKCLTLDYLDDLRSTGKLEGSERTSVMLHLCWVKVLNRQPAEGFLKIYDAEDLLQPTNRKAKLTKSKSIPVQVVSQSPGLPQQVSADASLRSHHPMEITRQHHCEDDLLMADSESDGSTKPQKEWQDDPTGMGGGSYVTVESTSSDNFNPPDRKSESSSDVAVVASKLPLNEWQSVEDTGWSSLKSNSPGDLQRTAFVSSGPAGLPHITKSLETASTQAKDVSNEYVCELKAVAPTRSSGVPSKEEIQNRPPKDVSNGYVGEFKAVAPTGSSGVPSEVEREDRPPKDVSNGYVGEFKGVGPTGSSGVPSEVEREDRPPKDVSNEYVGESQGVGPTGT